jgi:alpha-beta hydrolase superfamily lysophospholipase
MKLFLILFSAVFLMTASGLYGSETFTSNDATKLRDRLGVFGKAHDQAESGLFAKYLDWYGMKELPVREYGFFLSRGRRIFTMAVHPKPPRSLGTVLLLHGYLEHSGNLGDAAGKLAEKGYTVILYDMPGHGLSDGERGSIDDFTVYARTLEDMTELVRGEFPAPYFFVGHSTACAAAFELLHETPGVFDRVIFIAPLVRPSFWVPIRAALFFGSPFLMSIGRSYFDVSGDREYEDYLGFMEKRDPLQVQAVPLKWVKALTEWNDRLSGYPVITVPGGLTVIQGDADLALDWQANLSILRMKFSAVSVTMVPGGKHILFHETEKRKRIVFERLFLELSKR